MKVCFCGLGSIGRRHLLNFTRIAREKNLELEIHALRSTEKVLDSKTANLLSRQITQDSDLDSDYDIVFVTNPTSMHYSTVKKMAGKTRNMFIEKPVFDSGEYEIGNLALNPNGVYYVAGPLRFSPVIQYLKEFIKDNHVYCTRVICSSYLPDWRPNVDYRTIYSARKEFGGGVALDLIHEWDYLVTLYGFPERVYRVSGKFSPLEISSEDLAVYIAEYPNQAVELHLDYFGRQPRREIELFTENGTVIADMNRNTVRLPGKEKPISFSGTGDDDYLREMQFFLDFILHGKPYNNISHCCSIVNLALGRGTQ